METFSPPRSTAPVVDLDSRFAAQLDTVNKSMDEKLSAMSSALLSQFTVMLDQIKLGITNSTVSVKGVDREKSAVFKELTQSFRTYELCGPAEKKKALTESKTNKYLTLSYKNYLQKA